MSAASEDRAAHAFIEKLKEVGIEAVKADQEEAFVVALVVSLCDILSFVSEQERNDIVNTICSKSAERAAQWAKLMEVKH
jgi:hypothetical protein